MRKFKGLTILLAILLVFALIAATGCGSKDPAPAPAPGPSAGGGEDDGRPIGTFDSAQVGGMPASVFAKHIVAPAQEKVDAGTLSAIQADYIIHLVLTTDTFPPAGPEFAAALDDPSEHLVPDGYDGPRYVNVKIEGI